MTTSRQKNAVATPTVRNKLRSPEPHTLAAHAAAGTEWLGAYYAVKFSACGADALPNTKADALGWLSNAPAYLEQNFAYGDGDIRLKDFIEGFDDIADQSVPAEKNGIDSVIAAYISTHGGRDDSKETFCFLLGAVNGDCGSIYNTNMTLGDGEVRYLFFSTCASVSSADPGAIWWPPADGIRAVFGYDGSIADSAAYGKYFFQEWKKQGATTTQAFLDASWRVSHYQAPVAAWFGVDKKSAIAAQDTESDFQEDRLVGAQYISRRWYEAEKLQKAGGPLHLPNTRLLLVLPPPSVDPIAVLAQFVPASELGGLEPDPSGDNHGFRTTAGTQLMWNERSGSLAVTFPNFNQQVSFSHSDAEATVAATLYMNSILGTIPGAQTTDSGPALGLTPAALRRSYTGISDTSGPLSAVVTNMTVVFRQTVNGVPTIGTGGVVEITLNPGLVVSRVRMVMRAIAITIPPFPVPPGAPAPPGSIIDVLALQPKAEARALMEFTEYASREVVESEFGYYAADEAQQQAESLLSFRVVIEVSTGPITVAGAGTPGSPEPFPMQFKRRFERIYTATDLA